MRRFAAIVGATVLAAGLFAVVAPAAGAETTVFTENGRFTVPAGVCQVTIAAWGGAGEDGTGGRGGDSGLIQADFTVKPGDVLIVTVGERGSFGGAGFNNGGGVLDAGGGHGGGSSAVELNSSPLIIGAGGGGGAAGSNIGGGRGGLGTNDGNAGNDGIPNGGGAGGAFNGTPGDGGQGDNGGGGGGAGAAPGGGGDESGGGGGGNFVRSGATNVAQPDSLSGPGGEVRITPGTPGVGCSAEDDDDHERKAAPVAQPIVSTPAFTG